ncbi:MAG: membrane or secreted protein [Arcicella sp.]|nr:membrane or secreted protein [Arcicella sp.]
MKTIIISILLSISFFASTTVNIQGYSGKGFRTKNADTSPVSGAWQKKDATGNIQTLICSDNYLMYAVYDVAGKKFMSAGGGSYTLLSAGVNKIFSFKREFDTADSTLVGITVANKYTAKDNDLSIVEGVLAGDWKRIDESKSPKTMASVWRIRARENKDFKMETMLKGSRKTLKILSGSRFQWAAFNTDTHQFFGTGGGTYTVNKDGKYTENIEFFSRDNKRMGTSSTFDCVLNGKDWTHAGQSSTGVRVHEIWAKEE